MIDRNQMVSRVVSKGRMSNTGYHANGKPNWWVRYDDNGTTRFVDIEKVRGDHHLDTQVPLPVGTKVFIGAGKGSHKTIRETVITIGVLP